MSDLRKQAIALIAKECCMSVNGVNSCILYADRDELLAVSTDLAIRAAVAREEKLLAIEAECRYAKGAEDIAPYFVQNIRVILEDKVNG